MFLSSNQEVPKNDFQFYQWALLSPLRLSDYTRSLSEKTKLLRYILFFFKIDFVLILCCVLVHFLIMQYQSAEGFEQFYGGKNYAAWNELSSPFQQFWFILKISLNEFFSLLIIGFIFGLLHGYTEGIVWYIALKRTGTETTLASKIFLDLEDAYRQLGAMGISILCLCPFLTGYFHIYLLGVIYGATIAVYFALTKKPGVNIIKDWKFMVFIAVVGLWMMPFWAAVILVISFVIVFYVLNNLLIMRWIERANRLYEKDLNGF